MGCMVTASFLVNNPDLKLSGLFFSAPFFGMAKHKGIDEGKKF